MKAKLAKVTVRTSGNPIYFGRVRMAKSLTEFVYKGRKPTGNIEPKQRYMKISPINA